MDSNFNFSELLKFGFPPIFTQTRIDSECNDTTITLQHSSVGNLQKTIYIFSSSKLLRRNIIAEIRLEKNDNSGIYDTLEKKIYNNNGYEFFNKSDGKLTLYQILSQQKDSYGNDTSICFVERNSYKKTYDTITQTKYLRSYDTFGNNTATVHLNFNYTINKWTISKKVVNSFSQYASISKFHNKKKSITPVQVIRCGSDLFLYAPSISSVQMFNPLGKVIFSIKNNSNTVSLNLPKTLKYLKSGIYYISVHYDQNKQFSFSFLNNDDRFKIALF
jgi:hypothetical protein